MELYLLRHGQSQGNVLNIAGLDPPMTETGHRQIRRASERLATLGISHLYCSPLYRALQTAAILREQLSLDPVVDPVFCEIWGDDWKGRTRNELSADFPWANLPDSLENRWWPKVAETADEIAERAKRAIDAILQAHANGEDRVCLVGHVMFGSPLLRAILGIPARLDISFDFFNASITQILVDPDGCRIVHAIDDVSHLSADLWT